MNLDFSVLRKQSELYSFYLLLTMLIILGFWCNQFFSPTMTLSGQSRYPSSFVFHASWGISIYTRNLWTARSLRIFLVLAGPGCCCGRTPTSPVPWPSPTAYPHNAFDHCIGIYSLDYVRSIWSWGCLPPGSRFSADLAQSTRCSPNTNRSQTSMSIPWLLFWTHQWHWSVLSCTRTLCRFRNLVTSPKRLTAIFHPICYCREDISWVSSLCRCSSSWRNTRLSHPTH